MSKIPFFVLEGTDGSGTTTQAAILADRLRTYGRSILATRQPSAGPIGVAIRAILTGQAPPLASSLAFQLMFSADRLDHAARTILPAVDAGQVVLSDRYDLSTAIYLAASEPRYRCPEQGCGWTNDEWPCSEWYAKHAKPRPTVIHDHTPKDREEELLKQAFAWNRLAPRPLVTLVLTVSPEVAAARRAARGGPPELFEQAALQRRICGLYNDPHRTHDRGDAFDNKGWYWGVPPIAVINGEQDQAQVAEDVWAKVSSALDELDKKATQ